MADSLLSERVQKSFQWLALATVLAACAVVVGAIIRASGSGIRCPDWSLCQGKAAPVDQLPGTTLVSILILATTWFAWRHLRTEKWILRSAMVALALLALQIGLGGLTFPLELQPLAVGLQLINSLLLSAALVSAATLAYHPWPERRGATTCRRGFLPILAMASTAATLVLIVSGAVVTSTSAGYACPTWPLCNGQLLPTGTSLPLIAMVHRYFAAATGLLILFTLVESWRSRRSTPQLRTAGTLAAILFVVHIATGAINVFAGFPFVGGTLHFAAAAAVWVAMVAFALIAYQTSGFKQYDVLVGFARPGGAAFQEPRLVGCAIAHQPGSHSVFSFSAASKLANTVLPREVLTAYFSLTKPWIVALMLATTLSAMLVAQRGFPSSKLLFFTILGGALAAGGASALNSYLDRDIDSLMDRTSRRPIPSGTIPATHALVFALVLCTTGILVLAVFVNYPSAILSLIGAVYYALVYTIILKRHTPQNVVVGGVAGAIPPLVGWAAVTNQVSLLAAFLFLIIFCWTPPHTWALMLMIKKDYEKARVPMMPVVRGENATRRQILLYSLLMVAVTLVPFSLRGFGLLYFVTALLLGARFVHLAVRLWREESRQAARRLYYFSNAYLALLFLAMVLDQSALYIILK